jgi:tetratricopeptide (TPR) repeat protein
MSPWNPFNRKSREDNQTQTSDPLEIREPNDYDSFMQRGWANHAHGDQEKAESDFRRAVSYSPESVDANYALGLIMKSEGNTQDAIEQFEKTMDLILQGKIKEHSKSEMMRRLTLAHINELKTGDWNLEKEIWHQS